jgi:hypothetical protein
VGANQGSLAARRPEDLRSHWDWFTGCEYFGLDAREYIPVNFGMLPAFDAETLEENERYIIYRHTNGIVSRALKEGESRGMRASMDEYIGFPVKDRADFHEIKKRFDPRRAATRPAERLRRPAGSNASMCSSGG